VNDAACAGMQVGMPCHGYRMGLALASPLLQHAAFPAAAVHTRTRIHTRTGAGPVAQLT